jgi:hypothetical protein
MFYLMALKQYKVEVDTAVTDYNIRNKAMDLPTHLPTIPSTHVFIFCLPV